MENKYDKDDYFEEKKKRDNSEDKKLYLFDYKLIDGLMKYFTKEVKNEITTHKINKEIDGHYNGDDGIQEKRQVIKINI